VLPKFLQELDPNVYHSSNYTVLDFEVATNHGDFGRPIFPDNALLLAVWRTPEGLVKRKWGNELEQQNLFEDIARSDFIVAHNSIYELGWLRRGGFPISTILPFDTQLGEYVLLGNLVSGHSDSGVPPTSISLDSCANRRGWARKDPVVDILMGHGINPASMPRKWVEDRCIQDVETTHALFKDQLAVLSATNRTPVLFTRCLLTPVLADIQSEGMQLDAERVGIAYEEHAGKLVQLEGQLRELTGGINTNSPKQLGEYLYDSLGLEELRDRRGNPKRTDTGQRKTDAKTLLALGGKSAAQREFLGLYREQSKLADAISKSLRFFKGVCETQDGHFHADLNQTRTATHRLSSTGIPSEYGSVQFQNLAKAFKRLFKASRKDWLIAETDGSGLEFRVAGLLGDDPQIRKDLEDPNFDPHVTSGSVMKKLDYDELLAAYRSGSKDAKGIRDKAKPETFKPLYGGSKGTKEQERWYGEFKRRYSVLAETQKGWVGEVLRTKKLVTPWGMTFFFPNARMNASGYVNVGNAVYNYPVQCLATAEIIPIALVFLWHTIHARGLADRIKLVNTVHDSIVVELHPSVLDQYTSIVEDCFTEKVYMYLKRVYNMDFNVKLGVETTVGAHWGEDGVLVM
jgi:DNA polymerase I-like protein with 3'-5' exonuclease and polymerase domains